MTRQELKIVKTTKMLVAVILGYLSCMGLGIIFISLFSDSLMNTQVTDVLLTLNSALNFIIYCALGKGFRHSLQSVLCNCCRFSTNFTSSVAGTPLNSISSGR
jgi:uncharacterized membrane protein (DUF373 family)